MFLVLALSFCSPWEACCYSSILWIFLKEIYYHVVMYMKVSWSHRCYSFPFLDGLTFSGLLLYCRNFELDPSERIFAPHASGILLSFQVMDIEGFFVFHLLIPWSLSDLHIVALALSFSALRFKVTIPFSWEHYVMYIWENVRLFRLDFFCRGHENWTTKL